MLIKVNDGLVINTDQIAAACWDADQSRWRLALSGHEVTVYLTQSELDHIMNEVSTRQMIALMRMSGEHHRGQATKHRSPGAIDRPAHQRDQE